MLLLSFHQCSTFMFHSSIVLVTDSLVKKKTFLSIRHLYSANIYEKLNCTQKISLCKVSFFLTFLHLHQIPWTSVHNISTMYEKWYLFCDLFSVSPSLLKIHCREWRFSSILFSTIRNFFDGWIDFLYMSMFTLCTRTFNFQALSMMHSFSHEHNFMVSDILPLGVLWSNYFVAFRQWYSLLCLFHC
jgi:hypothetical protein